MKLGTIGLPFDQNDFDCSILIEIYIHVNHVICTSWHSLEPSLLIKMILIVQFKPEMYILHQGQVLIHQSGASASNTQVLNSLSGCSKQQYFSSMQTRKELF
jgi:hypothetical protein